ARFHLGRGLLHAQPFVNHGKAAGASIEHPHAQIVVLDAVPPRVAARLARFSFEALARDRQHVVESGDRGGFVAWCPPASTSPFALRCLLDDAGPRFDEASDDEMATLAAGLGNALRRLHGVRGDAPYNV